MYYNGISKISVFIDPYFFLINDLECFLQQFVDIKMLSEYLKDLSGNTVNIQYIFAKYILGEEARGGRTAFYTNPDRYAGSLTLIDEQIRDEKYTAYASKIVDYLSKIKDKHVEPTPQNISEKLSKDPNTNVIEEIKKIAYYNSLFNKGLFEALKLSEYIKANYFITSNSYLLENSKEIYRLSKIRVVDVFTFLESVSIFLKGHNIYVPLHPEDMILGLNVMNYYLMTDKLIKNYYSTMAGIRLTPEAQEYFRVAFMHRYNFMLYCRDQILSHQMQQDLSSQDEGASYHNYLASFYLNSFYLMLWGLLDNLAFGINKIFNLGIDDQRNYSKITFASTKKRVDYFKDKLQKSNINMYNLIYEQPFRQWMDDLAIKRHPSAHREPIFISNLYDEKTMEIVRKGITLTHQDGNMYLFEPIETMKHDMIQATNFLEKLLNIISTK